MSELFPIYKQQLETILNHAERLLQSSNYNLWKSEFFKYENESKRILKQMETDLNTTKFVKKQDMSAFSSALSRHKEQVQNLQVRFNNKVKADQTKEKNRLFLPGKTYETSYAREGPIHQNESVNDLVADEIKLFPESGLKLDSVGKEAKNVESILNNLKTELHRHTGDFQDIKSKAVNMNNIVVSSGALVRNFFQRNRRNKALLTVFSVGLVCMFLLILLNKSTDVN